MVIRFCLFVALPLVLSAEVVSFDKPVQIPEAVLQPGQYKISLEDRLADRAIVRITEPSGVDHYLLTVPSNKLSAQSKGVIFFVSNAVTPGVAGWECSDCKKPLEFVYPKDEAVKLTGETGKSVLAYDPSYDKLPSNLSAADRKVVTLWLLSPKTVKPSGEGEGLTAAKVSPPRAMASAEHLPKQMPKTATNAFCEILLGLVSLSAGLLLFWWRRVSHVPKIWIKVAVTALGGMVTGFALPIASSYQNVHFSVPPAPRTLVVAAVDGRDMEIVQLKNRNRRLEATIAELRQR